MRRDPESMREAVEGLRGATVALRETFLATRPVSLLARAAIRLALWWLDAATTNLETVVRVSDAVRDRVRGR